MNTTESISPPPYKNFNSGGTKEGRKYFCCFGILTFIPALILIIQNIDTYIGSIGDINNLTNVTRKVTDATFLTPFLAKLQEERLAVVFQYFIAEHENMTNIKDYLSEHNHCTSCSFTNTRNYCTYCNKNKEKEFSTQLQRLNLPAAFMATDIALEEVTTWPENLKTPKLKSKLRFQIIHAGYRDKMGEGKEDLWKKDLKLFAWYNTIIDKILDDIFKPIKTMDVGVVSKWIEAYRNLLLAMEYCGRSAFLAVVHLTSKSQYGDKHNSLVETDVLRRIYLNQTFYFNPKIIKQLGKMNKNNTYETFQDKIIKNSGNLLNIETVAKFATEYIKYMDTLGEMLESLTDQILSLVEKDIKRLQHKNILVIFVIILSVVLIIFCIVIMVTLFYRSPVLDGEENVRGKSMKAFSSLSKILSFGPRKSALLETEM